MQKDVSRPLYSKTRTTRRTTFSWYYELRTREPVSLWRENASITGFSENVAVKETSHQMFEEEGLFFRFILHPAVPIYELISHISISKNNHVNFSGEKKEIEPSFPGCEPPHFREDSASEICPRSRPPVLQSKGLWYSLEAQQGRRLWAHVIQSQHL